MVSPDTASEIACPMVAQAAVAVWQLLPSSPLTPLTYHVLASAGEDSKIRTPRTGTPVRFSMVASFYLDVVSVGGVRPVLQERAARRDHRGGCGAARRGGGRRHRRRRAGRGSRRGGRGRRRGSGARCGARQAFQNERVPIP